MRYYLLIMLLVFNIGCKRVRRYYMPEECLQNFNTPKMQVVENPSPLLSIGEDEDTEVFDLIDFEDNEPFYAATDAKNIVAKELSRLITIFSVKLKHDYYLNLEHSVAIFCNLEAPCLSRVCLIFNHQLLFEMCEARKLLVEVVEDLLDEINHNPIIEPALCGVPFSSENLEIYIDFESFHGRYVDLAYIGKIFLKNGIASYYAFSVKDCDLDCWKIRNEHYFQSRNIVKFQREGEKLHPVSNGKGLDDILETTGIKEVEHFEF